VDSFLGSEYVTSILHLKSDQLNELKKDMCVRLTDGSVVLLLGLASSIINLNKILKKKREEINKQAERLHSINLSISSATGTTSTIPPPTISSIFNSSAQTSSPSYASAPADSLNIPSLNSQTISNHPVNEITNKIRRTIMDWLVKNKHELNLANIDFTEGIDFRLEFNKRQDGIMMTCKCGTTNSIGQKHGVLIVRN
jgi:hypothetical protein